MTTMISTRVAGADIIAALALAADMLETAAAASESEQSMSDAAMQALRPTGLFGMLVPVDLGGNEVSPIEVYDVLRHLAYIDVSTAWAAAILLQGAGEMATTLPPEMARNMFAERIPLRVLSLAPGAGVQDGQCYRISGRWDFLSGLRQADYVAVTFEPADGVRRCALIPKDQLQVVDDWQVLGMRGTGSSSVVAEDVLVPASMTYDRFDTAAYARKDTPMGRLGPTRYVLQGNAAYPLGAARRALDELLDVAPKIRRGTRINTGIQPSLAESSWFQRELGELDARWHAADALARTTLERLGQQLSAGLEPTLADTDALQIASSFATQTGVEIVTRVFRAMGASAIRADSLISRQLRDLNTLAAHGGLSEAGFESHGAYALGLQDEDNRRVV